MGTLHEGSSLSDPDYTSSSESCNTVIYLGQHGQQSLSDRELTDNESVRSVPRTNPRLPRRASGSRSSGDEGSNSDSGHSLYRSRDSLSRLRSAITSPVRDVSVTSNGSRNTTPVRSFSRGSTPVQDSFSSDINSISSCSPPSVVSFNLPQKSGARSKTGTSKEGSNPYASVNIVDKAPARSGARPKRSNSSPGKEGEQWIDGPGAAIYPEKKQAKGEQWIDGPSAFVHKQEQQKHSKSSTKMSSEEMWVDGPPEMLAENQMDENQNRTPKVVMHTSSKKAHVRTLSSSPNSPALNHKSEPGSPKSSWLMPNIKERPDSEISLESGLSNTAQPADSRPNSMVTNVGDSDDLAQLENVKPFVKDWVERHGMPDADDQECKTDTLPSTIESSSGTFRRSKPQDCRTKKLLPSSSTPKQSPHHSPRQSPATQRKTKVSTPKLTKPNFPAPATTSRRVTDWLRSVESNKPEGAIYMEGIAGHATSEPSAKAEQQGLNFSQDISTCSSVYPDTTGAEADVSHNRDTTTECVMADVSFDSSVDTGTSVQNRDSVYEMQLDEQLENELDRSRKGEDDDDSFSNASCAKDSEMETCEPFVECLDSSMKKSETIQSIKTLVGDISDSIEGAKCGLPVNVCNTTLDSEFDSRSHLLSRKPDGASNPNLMSETYVEKSNISALREEYLIVNAISSQTPDLAKRSHFLSSSFRQGEADGRTDSIQEKCDAISSLPVKPCSKCGYSQQNSKTIAKMCKDCQKMVAASIKTSHNSVTRKDKDKSKYSSPAGAAASSPTPKCKVQSPSHSKLPVFSKNSLVSSKDSKSSRKKEKESKKTGFLSRTPSRHHDSDSGNDSGIVAVEKTLLSPYATVTKPRTVSHSSSGHGSDNSSTMSADLISKQGSSCPSDKAHGGTSSGYESMLRESDGSGSSTINEDSADESSGDKKKTSKKKKLPSKFIFLL